MPPANISTVTCMSEDTIFNLSTAIVTEQKLGRGLAMRNIWHLHGISMYAKPGVMAQDGYNPPC